MAKSQDDKPKKPKVKTGRPTDYTPELGLKICKAISVSTEGLQKLCDKYDFFPASKSTLYEWKWDHTEFADNYALAKQQQAELMADELSEIADDGSNDWMQSNAKDNPGWVINGEATARSRLRVDTRKWIACKLLPKVYGERPVEEEKPFSDSEKAELKSILTDLMGKHEREY